LIIDVTGLVSEIVTEKAVTAALTVDAEVTVANIGTSQQMRRCVAFDAEEAFDQIL
jgi:hypothetical protein